MYTSLNALHGSTLLALATADVLCSAVRNVTAAWAENLSNNNLTSYESPIFDLELFSTSV